MVMHKALLVFAAFIVLVGCSVDSADGPVLFAIPERTEGVPRPDRMKKSDVIALDESGKKELLATIYVADENSNPIQHFRNRIYFKNGRGEFVTYDVKTNIQSQQFLPGTKEKHSEYVEDGLYDFVVASGGLVIYLSGTCTTDLYEGEYACTVWMYDLVSGESARLGEIERPGIFGLVEVLPGQNGRGVVWIRTGSGDSCGSSQDLYVVDVLSKKFIPYSSTVCPCGPCVTTKHSPDEFPEFGGMALCHGVQLNHEFESSGWFTEITTSSGSTRVRSENFVGCRI
jgi:hypothetical protein